MRILTLTVLLMAQSAFGAGSFIYDNNQHWIATNASTLTWFAAITNISAVRVWLGGTDSPGSQYNADSGRRMVAMRLSATNSGNWVFCTDPNGSTLVTTNSGVAADTSRHIYQIVTTPTVFSALIDGTVIATLPAVAPSTSLQGIASVATLDNVAKGLKVYQFHGRVVWPP